MYVWFLVCLLVEVEPSLVKFSPWVRFLKCM